jgi:hypothetical protein
MTSNYYFILKDKSDNYLKLDGTVTKKKEEAATYYYNNTNQSIIYQNTIEKEKEPSSPYYREQVCINGCNNLNGYCVNGNCKCLNGYSDNTCNTSPSSSSSSSSSLLFFILLSVGIIGTLIVIYFIYRKKRVTQEKFDKKLENDTFNLTLQYEQKLAKKELENKKQSIFADFPTPLEQITGLNKQINKLYKRKSKL